MYIFWLLYFFASLARELAREGKKIIRRKTSSRKQITEIKGGHDRRLGSNRVIETACFDAKVQQARNTC